MSSTFDVGTAPHAIKIQFDENVSATLTPGDLVLQNLTAGTTISKAQIAVTFDIATRVATLTFTPGVLPDGNYHASILRTGVNDAGGNQLVADVNLDFFVLAGDVNHDRTVNFEDLIIVAQNYGQTGRTFAQGNLDYSVDGSVNFDDLILLAQHYNLTLTPPTIVAPVAQKSKHAALMELA